MFLGLPDNYMLQMQNRVNSQIANTQNSNNSNETLFSYLSESDVQASKDFWGISTSYKALSTQKTNVNETLIGYSGQAIKKLEAKAVHKSGATSYSRSNINLNRKLSNGTPITTDVTVDSSVAKKNEMVTVQGIYAEASVASIPNKEQVIADMKVKIGELEAALLLQAQIAAQQTIIAQQEAIIERQDAILNNDESTEEQKAAATVAKEQAQATLDTAATTRDNLGNTTTIKNTIDEIVDWFEEQQAETLDTSVPWYVTKYRDQAIM